MARRTCPRRKPAWPIRRPSDTLLAIFSLLAGSPPCRLVVVLSLRRLLWPSLFWSEVSETGVIILAPVMVDSPPPLPRGLALAVTLAPSPLPITASLIVIQRFVHCF